ncbi:MAG TPA: LD-carboxypeptidase [Candidatus Limnocylindrales bacterium]|nr:LD-carboxypeptidase [Candidatus Limnocylindrales bacterium]
MPDDVRKPRRLRPGDLIGVVAPATPWENRSELLRAVAGLERWGLQVRLGEHVNDRHAYLAGRDEDRAADLHAMWADPEVKAIICLQGGYGSPRLTNLLDAELIAANPKPLCGYSDITTLHLAVQKWAGSISFYSNGASGVGSAEVTDFSRGTMHRALFSDAPYGEIPPNPDDPYVRTITGGTARGRLTGGCLSLVQQSIGTRLEIETEGRILFLEDLDMHAFSFDSILTHLRNAGKLEECAGIVVGELKRVGWREDFASFMQDMSVEDVLEEVLGPLGIPVIHGLPIGHGKHHATVPVGAMATLDADAGRLVVEEVVTADD